MGTYSAIFFYKEKMEVAKICFVTQNLGEIFYLPKFLKVCSRNKSLLFTAEQELL